MQHVLMAMPLLALVLFLFLPWPAALALYIPIVSISMFAYWKVLQAILRPPVTGKKAMLGDRAEVVDLNGGQLEVRYHGEIWHAISAQPLQPGQQVIIKDIKGLTLRVEPLPQPAASESGQ
jgi:membrane protein implicated in regulation of membrane protease activity